MEYLRIAITAWLILILGLSMLQGRQNKKANRKRLASMLTGLTAIPALVLVYLTERYNWSVQILFIVPVILLISLSIGAIYGRYRIKCKKCEKLTGIYGLMLRDDGICTTCLSSVPSSLENIDWQTWKPDEEASLCYITTEEKILLINKKTGLGKGLVNGPGGRLESGESPIDSAIRECREEVGLTPLDPVKVAELYFQFKDGYKLKGHVYLATKWEGDLISTDEADPFWCPLEHIPYDQMWADDNFWLPDVLNGQKKRGYFIFDHETMLDKKTDNF